MSDNSASKMTLDVSTFSKMVFNSYSEEISSTFDVNFLNDEKNKEEKDRFLAEVKTKFNISDAECSSLYDPIFSGESGCMELPITFNNKDMTLLAVHWPHIVAEGQPSELAPLITVGLATLPYQVAPAGREDELQSLIQAYANVMLGLTPDALYEVLGNYSSLDASKKPKGWGLFKTTQGCTTIKELLAGFEGDI